MGFTAMEELINGTVELFAYKARATGRLVLEKPFTMKELTAALGETTVGQTSVGPQHTLPPADRRSA